MAATPDRLKNLTWQKNHEVSSLVKGSTNLATLMSEKVHSSVDGNGKYDAFMFKDRRFLVIWKVSEILAVIKDLSAPWQTGHM